MYESTDEAVDQPDEATKERRAAAKSWLGKIEASRDHDKEQRKKWAGWRRILSGKPEDPDTHSEFLVDAPLLQSVIETTLANVYANDPDVSATPSEAVSEARYEHVKAFGKTLQVVLSRQFKDSGLKAAIKRQAMSAMTNGVGWVKPMLQLEKRRDPVILRRISDVQDNLSRIEALSAAVEDPAGCGDIDVKRAELADQLRALQDQVEIQVARGTVCDYLRADDVQVDMECAELADYLSANWIAQRAFMSPDEAVERFGCDKDALAGAKMYTKRADGDGYAAATNLNAKAEVAVWEVWDRLASTVHTLAEGCIDYLRAPYSPNPVSRRFYPFFCLAFHWLDDERWPRSDVDLGRKLQEEASRALSNFAEHRRRVRPKIIFNRGLMSDTDADKIANGENLEMVGIDPTDPGSDISRSLFVPNYPQVDPGLYDITPYRQALEELFGLSETRRGGVIKTKTLGEAEMVEQGSETRMDWRREAVEVELTEIAQYLAELVLQAMPIEEAQRYAGADAMWPQLSKDDIYALLSVSVRAGSSGKPNTRSEQEAWSTLLPLIDKTITEIAGLLSNPLTVPLANVKIELLKETVRRLDDRIDVTRFIPKVAPMAPPFAVPGAAPVAALPAAA